MLAVLSDCCKNGVCLLVVFSIRIMSWMGKTTGMRCEKNGKYKVYLYSFHFVLALCYSYFMDGRVNKVEDFLKTRLLDTLAEQLSKVTRVCMVFWCSHFPRSFLLIKGKSLTRLSCVHLSQTKSLIDVCIMFCRYLVLIFMIPCPCFMSRDTEIWREVIEIYKKKNRGRRLQECCTSSAASESFSVSRPHIFFWWISKCCNVRIHTTHS